MFTLLFFLTNIARNFFSLTLHFTIRRPKRRKSREKFLRKKFENIFLFLAFDRNPLEDKYFINHTSSVTTCFPSWIKKSAGKIECIKSEKKRNQNGFYDITKTAVGWPSSCYGNFLNDPIPQWESKLNIKAGLIISSTKLRIEASP